MLTLRQKSRQSSGATLDAWQLYCREVAAAAEMLRDVAMRAEGAALAASVHENGLGRLAREFGFDRIVPEHHHNARTYATMMLGPFAALEELRRKLANT